MATDVTQQCKTLLAAGGTVRLPSGYITDELSISAAVKDVYFEGELALNSPSACVSASHVDGLTLHNINLVSSADNKPYAILNINESQRVFIRHPKVTGVKPGMNGILVQGCNNVDIEYGHIISGQGNDHDIVGIHVMGKKTLNTRDYWFAHKQPVPITKPCDEVEIRFTQFDGCYYGVYLSGANHCYVHSNKMIGNMRGIAVQDNANYNRVINNTITNNVSSGIHIAYGSSNNRVMYNKIQSNNARGEGILQSYVGSRNNIFSGNHVNVNGAKYLIYCGAHSDGCSFEDNVITGSASKAIVAMEAKWLVTPSDPRGRPAEDERFTLPDAEMVCSLIGNVFDAQNNVYLKATVDYRFNIWM